jgi:hypothetical protein
MEYQYLPFSRYPKNELGWVDANKHKPPDFILVIIETNLREIKGWWTGQDWYIRKLKPDEKVLNWRKIADHKNIH